MLHKNGDWISNAVSYASARVWRRLLELPQPEADQLGRVEWAATPMEVTKAYRKLSLLVRPSTLTVYHSISILHVGPSMAFRRPDRTALYTCMSAVRSDTVANCAILDPETSAEAAC